MYILAFETSCDETSVAVIENGKTILSNLVESQVKIHNKTGGIVPEVAAREHLKCISQLSNKALEIANLKLEDIDYIASTMGPGLPGALIVGFSFARSMAYSLTKPFIPVDHIEGHIAANWLEDQSPELPAVALVVSGGHTELILVKENFLFERLGGTRDDAAGEAFDKVSRMLDAGYPGGPAISKLASEATSMNLKFPRAWLRETNDFSFSGLKTAVLNYIKNESNISAQEIAWAFQDSVVDVLTKKTIDVAQAVDAKSIIIAGGVAANKNLRNNFLQKSSVPVHIPAPILCTDNAAMIGAAAFNHIDQAILPESIIDIYSTMTRGELFLDKK